MSINIELAYALPGGQQCVGLALEYGINARQALMLALEQRLIVLSDEDAQKDPMTLPIGVYGQIVSDDYCLKAGDRLEIYRPLLQDPKDRRRNIARQNASPSPPASASGRFSQK